MDIGIVKQIGSSDNDLCQLYYEVFLLGVLNNNDGELKLHFLQKNMKYIF